MPNSPHLPGDRFFARLRSFDMECPACGCLYIIRPTAARRSRISRTDRGAAITGFWSDVLQRFDCPACNAKFGLGIVAWPLRQGTRIEPATDSLPTKREAQRMRAMAGGWNLTTLSGGNEPRNLRITQPCDCQPDTRFVNPACPIHGEVQGRIPAAPQKVWYGHPPNKPRKVEYDDT